MKGLDSTTCTEEYLLSMPSKSNEVYCANKNGKSNVTYCRSASRLESVKKALELEKIDLKDQRSLIDKRLKEITSQIIKNERRIRRND